MSSYDRLPTETAKSYNAFVIYRNMGVSRSLDQVATEIYGAETVQKRSRNRSQIAAWSRQNNWVERCKDFDRDEEILERDRLRRSNQAEHDKKLELFRQQHEAIGMGLLHLAAQLLAAMTEYTAPVRAKLMAAKTARDAGVPLDPTYELDKNDHDVMQNIPNSIKGIAAFATMGGGLAADGLLVRQLMAHLKDNEGG